MKSNLGSTEVSFLNTLPATTVQSADNIDLMSLCKLLYIEFYFSQKYGIRWKWIYFTKYRFTKQQVDSI